LTYTGVLYTQKIIKVWDPNHIDASINQIVPLYNDTIKGLFYGQALNPSISASFSPQIFGTYDFTFKSPKSRIQQIRHVIKPSISFSFVPSLKGLSSRRMYRQVQVDSIPSHLSSYSIYDGNIFGTPSLSSRSGSIAFSVVNILEAKIFERKDTTGKPKKVKLIDNFSINSAYNIFADSMRWAPVTMQVRTTILNNVNVSASSSFSLYGTNSKGNPIGEFLWVQDKKLLRLTNFNTSLDFSLSELLRKNKDKNKTTTTPNPAQNIANQGTQGDFGMPGPGVQPPASNGTGARDAYGYQVFNVPWTLNLSYSFNYFKTALKPIISQTLSFNGSTTITKKMSATFTTGYDFQAKVITMTNIGITRDLHCWEMNLNWVPNGTLQSWNFLIRVKASVLGDLKYERRKDFHDSY
jgi:hypothetical protein